MMSAYLSREKDSMRLILVVNLALVHLSITIRDIQESVSGTLPHSRRSGASVHSQLTDEIADDWNPRTSGRGSLR